MYYSELQEQMHVTSLKESYIAHNQKFRDKTFYQVIFVKEQIKALNKGFLFTV